MNKLIKIYICFNKIRFVIVVNLFVFKNLKHLMTKSCLNQDFNYLYWLLFITIKFLINLVLQIQKILKKLLKKYIILNSNWLKYKKKAYLIKNKIKYIQLKINIIFFHLKVIFMKKKFLIIKFKLCKLSIINKFNC